MKKIKVGSKVKIISTYCPIWTGKKGTVVCIVLEGWYKEYIVQFHRPREWSYFRKRELKVVKV